MDRLSFRQLPLIVKIAVGIVFYNAWWSIEEFVIDRHGLWKYMPYYRVADPCLWDLFVALIIGFGLWHLSRRREPIGTDACGIKVSLGPMFLDTYGPKHVFRKSLP